MELQITNIFLGMALIAALNTFIQSPKDILHWTMFIYFILTNIRYYYGDIRWTEVSGTIGKANLGFARAIGVIFYVITRLTVVVVALNINKINNFFPALLLSLFFGSLSLIFSITCILDKSKDTSSIKLFPIQWHWFWFNCAEIAIILIALFIHNCESDIYKLFPNIATVSLDYWCLIISFALLFFIMIIDWIMHHSFLFER